MKAEILIKFACETCGRIQDTEYDAEKCCPNQAAERFICSVCNEVFHFQDEADLHLETPHGNSELTPEEIYHQLLFEGKPSLGQWHVRMMHETEFLIPPDKEI